MNGNLRETYLGNGIMISADNDDELFLRNMLEDYPSIRMEPNTVRNFLYFVAERMPWLSGESAAESPSGNAPTVF